MSSTTRWRTGALLAALWLCAILAAPSWAEIPLSYGTTACGKLTGGVALPCSGENFEAYHWLGCALGRNYLHPVVRDTVLDAYALLAEKYPTLTWQYGETGNEDGGRFRPHRTHQNGTSVDFFFPVVDTNGKPALSPTGMFDKFGYDVDFSSEGRLGDLRIHWEAITDHLIALNVAGKKKGVSMARIILAPALQKQLVEHDPRAKQFVDLANKKPAWVLHDEHYHIDFSIPEKFRRPLKCD